MAIILLPIEIKYNIYSYLTLDKLFELNRMQTHELYYINNYIDYYFDTHKYKDHSRLKDCMYLIKFEEYREIVYEYLYELISDIGIKFVNDVNKVGITTYTDLSMEEKPRKIYTITITLMIMNSTKIEYSLTNIGYINSNNRIYYNFGYYYTPKNTRFIECNYMDITNELFRIIDIMRLDNRQIISIRYCSEKYNHDFIKLNTSSIINEEYNIF